MTSFHLILFYFAYPKLLPKNLDISISNINILNIDIWVRGNNSSISKILFQSIGTQVTLHFVEALISLSETGDWIIYWFWLYQKAKYVEFTSICLLKKTKQKKLDHNCPTIELIVSMPDVHRLINAIGFFYHISIQCSFEYLTWENNMPIEWFGNFMEKWITRNEFCKEKRNNSRSHQWKLDSVSQWWKSHWV